jgi:surface antigen
MSIGSRRGLATIVAGMFIAVLVPTGSAHADGAVAHAGPSRDGRPPAGDPTGARIPAAAGLHVSDTAYPLSPPASAQRAAKAQHVPSAVATPDAYTYDYPSITDCQNNLESYLPGGWFKNHYSYCRVGAYRDTIKQVDDAGHVTIVATATRRATVLGKGSFDGRTVTFTVYVDQVQVTFGTLPPGTEVSISVDCRTDWTGACGVAAPPAVQPYMSWNNSSHDFTFTSPDGIGLRRNVYDANTEFAAVSALSCATCIVEPPDRSDMTEVRFDGPVTNGEMEAGHPRGATFTKAVPVMAFDYTNPVYGEAAQHYYTALNFPFNTYPHDPGKVLPQRLSRFSGPEDRAYINSLCAAIWGAGYSQGGTRDCDEYPFSSTYQSATHAGIPVSVCDVHSGPNRSAGARLGRFYLEQRIFDEDKFDVTVVNVPTGAPATPPCSPPTTPLPGPPPAIYPPGAYGPGAATGFATTGTWHDGGGTGEEGRAIWTAGNGAQSNATATWTAASLPVWQYSVRAWIPATADASAAHAHYQMQGRNTVDTTVDQNASHNTWVTLATLCPSGDGMLTVHLDNGGGDPANAHLTADAIQLAQAPQSCAATPTVGHAKFAGNDYPFETLGQFEHQQLTDPWNEFDGQCDSFAAWKVYENLGGTAQLPAERVPDQAFHPSDAGRSPVWGTAGPDRRPNWGDARDWGRVAPHYGYAVDLAPRPGAIAWWSDQGTGMPVGHVGYVTDVYPDGSITIENYNLRVNGEYSTIHMGLGGATDSSFGRGDWQVPWPTGFIHIGDTDANITQPPQPPPAAPFHYPHNVYGPGDGGGFSLAGSPYPGSDHGWYTRIGHGEIGAERWTNTHGPTADSTATWNPPGLSPGACYRLDAFVPDNYSNTVAIYHITDQTGTRTAVVDENAYTNDWAELGVFQATGAGIQTTLTDIGPVGHFAGADGLRVVRQNDCSAQGVAQPVILPGDSAFATTGTWQARPGHGLTGNEQYTGTATAQTATAIWNPTLIPGACYHIAAYVPDNYSNTAGALYTIFDAAYTQSVETVDEDAYTNQFAALGTYRADSSGRLEVMLSNTGPAGHFVAADALQYSLDPGCTTLNRPYPTFQGPADRIYGPGSGAPFYSTTHEWFNRFDHGLNGHEQWTHTNGTTAVSTATWQPWLKPNSCYKISAFIPDNYANNPTTHYDLASAVAGFGVVVNQQGYTNEWADLGTLPTGADGVISVSVNDLGPVGYYVAADAMRFTQTPC